MILEIVKMVVILGLVYWVFKFTEQKEPTTHNKTPHIH